MQIKLRKLWPAVGLMCMSLFSTANAQTHNSHSQHDSMSMSSQGAHDKGNQGTYQRGTYREITPNAGPRVVNGADVFITADFIWWKTVQEGTRYGSTGVAPGNLTALTNVPSGHSRSVGESWDPGFKVGLGLDLSHDGWDIYAEYTWLRPSNNSSINQAIDATTGAGVTSRLSPNTNNGPYGNGVGSYWRWDRIHSEWHLHFNVIDLELGRNFYLSQFLTMRPFIGLKGTWQEQSMKSRHHKSTGVDLGLATDLTGPYQVHQTNNVWGIGVRGGFDISWYFSKNWSIYGDLAWTTMWTDYTELRRRDIVDDISTDSATTMVHTNANHWYSVKYIGEMELGLRWDMWFSDDNYHFAIQAGWEQQVWLSWNSLHSLTEPDNWNDLNFQGLNLKFRFDF